MIQMKFFRGGIIDVPEDPVTISLLMNHGFTQSAKAADADGVLVSRGVGDEAETDVVEAEGSAVAAAIRDGYKITSLQLKEPLIDAS